MKKILCFVLLFLFFVYILVSITNILKWYKWYVDKKVSFIVDIDFFVLTNNDVKRAISKFTQLGINLFATDIENFVLIKDDMLFNNCKFVLKIYDQKIYNVEKIVDVVDKNKDKIFSIIYLKLNKKDYISLLIQKNFYGRKISQEEINKFFENCLLFSKNQLFKLNFEQQEFITKINFVHTKLLPLRSFFCDLSQINSDKKFSNLLLKIKKAVFERSCSIIYILPSEYVGLSENVEFIKSLVNKFGNNIDFCYPRFSSIHINKISNFIVVIIAVVLPLVVFKKITNFVLQNSVDKIYYFANILIIIVGFTIWGFLQKYEYIAKEEFVYGIKLMFLLPVIISFFVILDKEEKNFLLNYSLTIKDVMISILLVMIFGYLLLRTGNVGREYILKFELNLREQIEKYILFRPRFKEVFFAQPLFIFSLQMMKNNPKRLIIKLLFCTSIISFVSIINTFLHVHTPVWLCVLRSVTGVIFGWIIGKICLLVSTKICNEEFILK